MPFQVSPGVNVTEIDLTTIVPAVATTIGGFAGAYVWGPADEIVRVDSPKNYRSLFGDPYDWNATSWFSAENFLRYGRNLLVVRVTEDDAVNANTQGTTAAKDYIPNDGTNIGDTTTYSTANFYARFPGSLGNSLKVSIGSNGVTSGSNWQYYNVFGRTPKSSDNLINLAGGDTKDQVHMVVVDEDGLFTGSPNTVLERFENVSLHPEAKNLNGESNYILNVVNTKSKYVKISGSLDTYPLGTAGDTTTAFGGLGDGTPFASLIGYDGSYTFTWSTGVTQHWTASMTGGTGEKLADGSTRTTSIDGVGYKLFEDTENVDVNLIIGGSNHDLTNVTNLKNLVEARKDCVLFVSPEVNGSDFNKKDSEKATECINFVNTIVQSSSYVVVDSGYKKQFDPYNQVFRWIPLNADIAGLCARTDASFDPWFSPAGLNRGQIRNVEALAFNPNQTYRDQIYPEGVNPVVFIPGEGTVLYGDKTAQNKPSAFDRINVRRLFIVLEKAISTASKFSLFEQNDSFTRQQFRSLVEPFLRDVKARRGIFDFKVVCDETNNSPESIDRNEFTADIYIKPSRTINYIQLNFIATRTGVSFEEVGA